MASRRTYQCAAVIFMVVGVMGKFGAVLSCIPSPVLGAIMMYMFGMVTSLGLSYLESIDLRSSRNLVVLAISFSAGMTVPTWMNNNPGVIDTGRFITVRCRRMSKNPSFAKSKAKQGHAVIIGAASAQLVLTKTKQCKVQLQYKVMIHINLTSAPDPGQINLIVVQYIIVHPTFIWSSFESVSCIC